MKREPKVKNNGYKPPKWFQRIKPGSHGSTPSQKRLWRVISETYRKEDWEKSPTCRTCGKHLETWQVGQCGHYKAWSECNAWFKYDRKNLAIQCAYCNANFHKTNTIGGNFALYLMAIYGSDILSWIERTNQTFSGVKMHEWELVDYAARVAPHLVE